MRNHASEDALRLLVLLVLAREKEECLCVSALKEDRSLLLPIRGHCVADETAGPLRLERPASKHRSQFGTEQNLLSPRNVVVSAITGTE